MITELKLKIIDSLNLDGMTPEDIDNDGLGLDSIDVLELIVLMEKSYGIRLDSPSKGKEVFRSVAVMAQYIADNRTK